MDHGVRGLASPHPILGATRVVDKGGMYKAGVAGLFHFVLCSFRLVPGPDARRHGRFGPEGQLCSVLVLLVIVLFVLCSVLLTIGPRCTTSWPVRIRSSVMSVLGWFAGDSATRAVFLPVVRPKMRCIMAGMDQRYSMSVLGWFAGESTPRAVFLPVVRPKMRCIMAGMDQRYSCVSAWMVSSCLDQVVHTPVVCNDICLRFRLQKIVQAPQLQFV